ncbi:LpqB family beta-propeller domain-containing protein [Pseudactinotalea terrae]|uniref:LpqB family beta-propeller domain-containing protein n=1 Tax=Pseudactinotalea terrae TaxID=1743262 RepID=UPI0012E2BE0B|nr:LpqB family beta-propeller domain-containing protein [Pseudactinotalea terrae]
MRRRLLALAAIVMVALSGCLSLPTESGIQQGHDGPPVDGGLELVAPGPAEDAEPDDIVEGFLLAASFGLGDDFGRAHEFMTTAGAAQWNALGGVTVYSDAEPLEVVLDDQVPGAVGRTVTVTAAVVATVAPDGTYTEALPGTVQELQFQVIQIAGDQWRISQLEQGVLMSEVTFGTQYREVPIYFLSGNEEPRLVPDLRWLPRSQTVLGSVRSLLGGPADWLSSPAVVTAFPGGTQLAIEGIEIADRVATVALSPEFLSAGAVDRAYAQRQLAETLRQLGQVNRVQISVEGNILEIEESLAPITITPVPARGPVLLIPEGLGLLSGNSISDLSGDHGVPAGLGPLALPYESGPIVGLVESTSIVALNEGGAEPTALFAPGGRLLAPSYDVHGWVWTGPTGAGTNPGELTVIDPQSGAIETVAAADLVGVDVVALRVSREGARLAYAVQSSTSVVVYVSAIERDGDGRPVAISQGQPIGASLTSLRDLVWVDDVELGVLGVDGDSDLTVLLVGVGGRTAPLPSVQGAVSIAAGDGRRELFLVTDAGDLYGRSGNGWRKIDGPAASPTFAG